MSTAIPNDDDAADLTSLVAAKRRVSKQYLGKLGIHGVGVAKQELAIRVVVSDAAQRPGIDELAELQACAAPYRVVVEVEPTATTRDADT